MVYNIQEIKQIISYKLNGLLKSIRVQLSDVLMFKPVCSTPSLMKPVRSIIS